MAGPAGSFLANPISHVLSVERRARSACFVWAHLCFVLGFLAYLPHSKHLHIATAAVNVWFRAGHGTGGRGRLESLRFDLPDDELRFGAGDDSSTLTSKEVLDGFSCTEWRTLPGRLPRRMPRGRSSTRKLLIMGIRDQVLAAGRVADRRKRRAGGDDLGLRDVWRVRRGVSGLSIEHVDHIIDLRRSRRDGRLAVPGRRPSRCCATSRRAVEPVGQAADGACRLGGGARCEGARAG